MAEAAEQDRSRRSPQIGTTTPKRSADSSAFRVLKPGQGLYVRWGSAISLFIMCVAGGFFLHDQLVFFSPWVQKFVPIGVIAILTYLIFWGVGRNRTVVDFMIATEGEMKKVNWSTRREVLGATKVVIASVLALGFLLFVVNLVFMFLFESIGVLRTGMVSSFFGGGGAE